MASKTVFERKEMKYLLPQAQVAGLMDALAPHCVQDAYGKHTICSLYYDTPDFACARRQEEKPDFREKLRLRSYGVPRANDIVYLELKKKALGVTYKRRMPLTLAEARDYMDLELPPLGGGQVLGEIEWFKKRMRLEEKAVICYDRVAMNGRQEPELRITLDRRLRWRTAQPDLARGDWGAPLGRPGDALLEIKTVGALPLWLCGVLSRQALYPTSFSKYMTVYKTLQRQEVRRDVG